MGHGDAGGQEPHQPDADGEPVQAHHRRRGAEAPVDLRKCSACRRSPPAPARTNGNICSSSPQQRERVASVVHRQETVDCLKKFNARRKLKVCTEARSACPHLADDSNTFVSVPAGRHPDDHARHTQLLK